MMFPSAEMAALFIKNKEEGKRIKYELYSLSLVFHLYSYGGLMLKIFFKVCLSSFHFIK